MIGAVGGNILLTPNGFHHRSRDFNSGFRVGHEPFVRFGVTSMLPSFLCRFVGAPENAIRMKPLLLIVVVYRIWTPKREDALYGAERPFILRYLGVVKGDGVARYCILAGERILGLMPGFDVGGEPVAEAAVFKFKHGRGVAVRTSHEDSISRFGGHGYWQCS